MPRRNDIFSNPFSAPRDICRGSRSLIAYPAALLAAIIVAPAVASTPSPPPPWERGFVISDWVVVCALTEPDRYSSCTMRRDEWPLEIAVHVHDGPTRYKLRRNCLARGTVYIEREGEIGADGLVAGLKQAVADIAAEDCRTGGGKPPKVPDLPDWFYERMNLIFLLMKSF